MSGLLAHMICELMTICCFKILYFGVVCYKVIHKYTMPKNLVAKAS